MAGAQAWACLLKVEAWRWPSNAGLGADPRRLARTPRRAPPSAALCSAAPRHAPAGVSRVAPTYSSPGCTLEHASIGCAVRWRSVSRTASGPVSSSGCERASTHACTRRRAAAQACARSTGACAAVDTMEPMRLFEGAARRRGAACGAACGAGAVRARRGG
eukprot:7083382-Prymnesium_polylepis.1